MAFRLFNLALWKEIDYDWLYFQGSLGEQTEGIYVTKGTNQITYII